MIFYSTETLIGLCAVSIPALLSLYFFYIKGSVRMALICLLGAAFLLRILMISLDPFLHEWDEQFHALVAKNMMDHPFKPMLFIHPVLPYQVSDWSYNHIWVHKQPLFLWQMMLSMKIFGINTFGLRFPSAVMGTVMVWLIFGMAKKWTANIHVAYMASFLSCFAYYALELTSGLLSLDHNDLAFTFYMTASFWAFINYVHRDLKMQWAIITGCLAGMAILNKWLPGLLIFGGWGLYLFLSQYQFDLKKWIHLVLSLVVACLVFLPWQIYILHAFPLESAAAFEDNKRHLSESLGHPGSAWFHLKFLSIAYHLILLVFLLIGIHSSFRLPSSGRKISIVFLSMTIVFFGFFSIVVTTRMPAFVYPVSSIILILMALGLYTAAESLSSRWHLIVQHRNELMLMLTFVAGYFSLKPELIMHARSHENESRNMRIHNTIIMKNMDETEIGKRILFNTKSYENIELMFYKNVTAYHWYPQKSTIDSLKNLGVSLAAFQFSSQYLPEYIQKDTGILILNKDFQ